MLVSGLKLMFLGMAVVYGYLLILYVIIRLTGKLLHRELPPEREPPLRSDHDETAAVISAAIGRFRSSRE